MYMTWWMDQSPRSASGALRSQLPAWLNRRQPHRVDLRDPHSKNPWKSWKIAMFGHIYLLYHNCKPALYHNCKPALWTSEKQCAVSDHELCRIGQVWWLLEVLEVITKYTQLLLYHHRSLPESNVAGWGNPRNIIYNGLFPAIHLWWTGSPLWKCTVQHPNRCRKVAKLVKLCGKHRGALHRSTQYTWICWRGPPQKKRDL